MGIGSIRGMITSLKFNKMQMSKRKKYFDKKGAETIKPSYGEFTDHKKMKTYEYAAFQKKIFTQKKREHVRFRVIVVVTIVIVILIFIAIPYLVEKFIENGHSDLYP